MELIARVKAVLRRGGYGLRVGGIELDEKRHAVYANGQNVQLTLKEYELLSFLMAHAGTAFDREQLLSEVWGMDYFGGTRTVDVHVQTLRQKLGSCGANPHGARRGLPHGGGQDVKRAIFWRMMAVALAAVLLLGAILLWAFYDTTPMNWTIRWSGKPASPRWA